MRLSWIGGIWLRVQARNGTQCEPQPAGKRPSQDNWSRRVTSSFCPSTGPGVNGRDRVKQVELPLFPGYLFCRFDVNSRLPILVTPGVKLIVGCGKTPVAVSEGEIGAIRNVIESGAAAEPWPFLTAGQRVRIQDGSLAGLEGILLQVKTSWRIVLSVDLLQRSVAVEVDRASVVPVSTASASGYRTSRDQGSWTPASDARNLYFNSGD